MRGRESFNVKSNALRQVSANRCHIKTIVWHNDDAAARFLQIFNVRSASVTLGTTVPNMVIQMGADATNTFDLGDSEFSTAFSYAVITTAGGNTGGTSSW